MGYGIYNKLFYCLIRPVCTNNVKLIPIIGSMPLRKTIRPTSRPSYPGLERRAIMANIAVGKSTGCRPDTTGSGYQPGHIRSVQFPRAFPSIAFGVNSEVRAVSTRFLI
jgi:hypothetical protein